MENAYAARTAPVGINSQALSNGLLVLLGSLAIGLLAQAAIPVGPIPVTGQTLGVLAIAAMLGPRRGPLSVLLYLGYGAAGLPFFAGGTGGMLVLMGPTAGYLVGFVAAAWFAGGLLARPGLRGLLPATLVLTGATAIIYGFGVMWLSRFVGWDSVLAFGVMPFLFGDALKIAIVAAAAAGLPRI